MNNAANKAAPAASAPIQGIRRWFGALDYRYPDAASFFRARLLLRLSRIIIILGPVNLLLVIAQLNGPNTLPGFLPSIIGSVVALIGSVLTIGWIQQGRRQRAEFIFTLTVAIGAGAFFVGYGANSVTTLVLVYPVLIAAFLFGTAGTIWLIVTLGVLILVRNLFSSQFASYPPIVIQPDNPNLFYLAATLLLIAGLAALLISFLNLRDVSKLMTSGGQALETTIVPLITTIAGYRTYHEMYEKAAEDLRVRLNYYYIQLFVYDDPSRLLVRSGQIGSFNAMLRQERRIALEDPRSAIAEAGRSGTPRLITLTAEARDRAEFLVGTRAELALPIVYENTLIGVLDIHSTQATAFSADEIAQLQAVGTLIAFALRQLKQSDEASVGQDERDAMRAEIGQLREQISESRQDTIEEDWQAFLGGRSRTDLSFLWTASGVRPASADDVITTLETSAALNIPQIHVENGQQVLSVPIVVNGQPLGSMMFYAPPDVRWDERSLITATTIGQRFTLLVENLRLIEESRAAELREKLINQVTGQLQAQTSLDALLATAADVFSRSLGATSTKIQIAPEDHPTRLTSSLS